MKDLMLLLAKEMPEDMLVKELMKAVNEYSENPNEDTKRSLAMFAMMISLRFSTEDKGTLEIIEDMNKAEKLHNVFSRQHS